MKKTCLNCIHYHGCLTEESSRYHVHDYCDKHNRSLTYQMDSQINALLNSVDVFNFNDIEKLDVIYDDLETGEAFCTAYREKKYSNIADSVFDENKKSNKQLALNVLNAILKNEKIVDKYGHVWRLDSEELAFYAELKDKILNNE